MPLEPNMPFTTFFEGVVAFFQKSLRTSSIPPGFRMC